MQVCQAAQRARVHSCRRLAPGELEHRLLDYLKLQMGSCQAQYKAAQTLSLGKRTSSESVPVVWRAMREGFMEAAMAAILICSVIPLNRQS